jgi:hypothetical protein
MKYAITPHSKTKPTAGAGRAVRVRCDSWPRVMCDDPAFTYSSAELASAVGLGTVRSAVRTRPESWLLVDT